MDGHDPASYGERIAEVYDAWYGQDMDPGEAVELLAGLAGGGRVLELGIGTGRVALPLAERGVDVSGIDASEAMVAKLRVKPGGDRIPVSIGDFADVDVAGQFALVYLPFATLFALTTQAGQVRCFRNVAGHLEPGGRFVLDAFVPEASRLAAPQPVGAESTDRDEVVLAAMNHDPVDQVIEGHHVLLSEKGTRLFPLRIRYCWPSEMDLMAELAGLVLEARMADYAGHPFGPTSEGHVSIYRKPSATGSSSSSTAGSSSSS